MRTPKNTCHILLTKGCYPKKSRNQKFQTPKYPLIILVTWNLNYPTLPPPPTFTRVLVSKWYGLCRLCLSGMVFEGTMEVYECIYHFSSKWLRKKEKYANSKWILTNLFRCSSSLSKDYVISYRTGLKKGVNNHIFWSERVQNLENRVAHPHQELNQHNPPGLFLHKKSSYAWHTVVMQSLCRMLV